MRDFMYYEDDPKGPEDGGDGGWGDPAK